MDCGLIGVIRYTVSSVTLTAITEPVPRNAAKRSVTFSTVITSTRRIVTNQLNGTINVWLTPSYDAERTRLIPGKIGLKDMET